MRNFCVKIVNLVLSNADETIFDKYERENCSMRRYDRLLIEDTLKNLCVKVVDFISTDVNGMIFSKLISFICIHISMNLCNTLFELLKNKKKEMSLSQKVRFKCRNDSHFAIAIRFARVS